MTKGAYTITLSCDERMGLDRLIANRNTPAKVVWRAEIVLATARGLGTGAIHKETGKDKTTIWRWQERYLDEGVEGLMRDKTRPPGHAAVVRGDQGEGARQDRERDAAERHALDGAIDGQGHGHFSTRACSASGARPASSRIS